MERLDHAFAALADPTRRALLARLERGATTLSELAGPLPMTLMAVQKHVKTLEQAGLVQTWKDGRSRHVQLRPEGLKAVEGWIRSAEARWNAAFDRLERALEDDES